MGDARVTKRAGRAVVVTATPARHGPAGIEPLSGDVIGFVLGFGRRADTPDLRHRRHGLVRRRGRGRAPLPSGHRGAVRGRARTRGPFDLTMDTNDAVEAAHRFA